MADTKASAFTIINSGSLVDADVVPIVAGNTTNKRTLLSSVAAYIAANPTVLEAIRDTIATALVAGSNVTITPNDGADTITIAASGGGGGGVAAHPGYVSGAWYRGIADTLTTVTVAADTPYAHPIFLPEDVTLQALGIRVGTGVGGSNVKMAIYSNVSGRPGTKLHNLSAAVATASSSANATGGFSANPTLTAGWYWLAAIFSHTPGVTGIGSAAAMMPWAVGIVAAASLSTASTGVTGTGATYSGGLLSTFGTATVTTASVPNIMIQVA